MVCEFPPRLFSFVYALPSLRSSFPGGPPRRYFLEDSASSGILPLHHLPLGEPAFSISSPFVHHPSLSGRLTSDRSNVYLFPLAQFGTPLSPFQHVYDLADLAQIPLFVDHFSFRNMK